MAKKSIKNALEQVELTYQELVEIANDMVNPFFDPINKLVDNLTNINDLSTNEIRNFMIDIAINSYRLGEVKEKASLKSELAEAIRKETYAKKFSEAEGTAGAKDTFAVIESSEQLITQCLYELVASLLKTKMSECHSLIDVCKTVIMSRMSEAKLTNNNID